MNIEKEDYRLLKNTIKTIETFKFSKEFHQKMKDNPLDDLRHLDLSPYKGEWIAILNHQVISHGIKMKDVYYDARKKFPGKTPFITKMPGKEVWLF